MKKTQIDTVLFRHRFTRRGQKPQPKGKTLINTVLKKKTERLKRNVTAWH